MEKVAMLRALPAALEGSARERRGGCGHGDPELQCSEGAVMGWIMSSMTSPIDEVRRETLVQLPAIVDALCDAHRSADADGQRMRGSDRSPSEHAFDSYVGFELVLSIIERLMQMLVENFHAEEVEVTDAAEECMVELVKSFIGRQREVLCNSRSDGGGVASETHTVEDLDADDGRGIVSARTQQYALLEELLRVVKEKEAAACGLADPSRDEMQALMLRTVFQVLPEFAIDVVVCSLSCTSASKENGEELERMVGQNTMVQLMHDNASKEESSFAVRREIAEGVLAVIHSSVGQQEHGFSGAQMAARLEGESSVGATTLPGGQCSGAGYHRQIVDECVSIFEMLCSDDTWVVRASAMAVVPKLVAVASKPCVDARHVMTIARRVVEILDGDNSRQVEMEAARATGPTLAAVCDAWCDLHGDANIGATANGHSADGLHAGGVPRDDSKLLISLMYHFLEGCAADSPLTGVSTPRGTGELAVDAACAASAVRVIRGVASLPIEYNGSIFDDDDNDPIASAATVPARSGLEDEISPLPPQDDDDDDGSFRRLASEVITGRCTYRRWVAMCIHHLSNSCSAEVRSILAKSSHLILEAIASFPDAAAPEGEGRQSASAASDSAVQSPGSNMRGKSLSQKIVDFYVFCFHDDPCVRDAALACLGEFIAYVSVTPSFRDGGESAIDADADVRLARQRVQIMVLGEIMQLIFERKFVDEDGKLIDDPFRLMRSKDEMSARDTIGVTPDSKADRGRGSESGGSCSLCTDWRLRACFAVQGATLVAATFDEDRGDNGLACVLLQCCISLLKDPVAAVREVATKELCVAWRWMYGKLRSDGVTAQSDALVAMMEEVSISLRDLANHTSYRFRQMYIDVVMSLLVNDAESGAELEERGREAIDFDREDFCEYTFERLCVGPSLAELSVDRIANVRMCLEGWKEKLSRGDGGVHTKLIDAATAVAVTAT